LAWVQDDAMFGGKPIRAREYMTGLARLRRRSSCRNPMKPSSSRRRSRKDDYDRLREYLKYLGTLDPSFK
jgi:hypothetical protein